MSDEISEGTAASEVVGGGGDGQGTKPTQSLGVGPKTAPDGTGGGGGTGGGTKSPTSLPVRGGGAVDAK
ncbi:MAG TPA: hypothetical protein VEG34_13010 [Thermoanaerobaculia bacterium]|nr:hypothetical protein [Thermoanaerobaculia bacterium]